MKGINGFGCPAIIIGAVGFTAITCAVAVGIVPTRGIIIGITAITTAIMIAAMIATTIAVGIATKKTTTPKVGSSAGVPAGPAHG
jgi:hypothetical protein